MWGQCKRQAQQRSSPLGPQSQQMWDEAISSASNTKKGAYLLRWWMSLGDQKKLEQSWTLSKTDESQRKVKKEMMTFHQAAKLKGGNPENPDCPISKAVWSVCMNLRDRGAFERDPEAPESDDLIMYDFFSEAVEDCHTNNNFKAGTKSIT